MIVPGLDAHAAQPLIALPWLMLRTAFFSFEPHLLWIVARTVWVAHFRAYVYLLHKIISDFCNVMRLRCECLVVGVRVDRRTADHPVKKVFDILARVRVDEAHV